MTPIRKIEKVNAAEAVCEQLIGLIKTGEIEVGGKLPSEQELSQAFGVSRPVIREALGFLRASGLVVSQAGRGTFVAAPGASRPPLLGRYSVTELHEVRCHLEIPGAAAAAERRTQEQLAALGLIVGAIERCEEVREWVRLDAAFHVALAEASGNGVLARLVEHLRDLLVDQSIAVVQVEGRIAQANLEHRAIFEATVSRDSMAARRAMSTHLFNVYHL